GPAINLSVDDHRVHEHAAVLDDDVIDDLDFACLRIAADPRGVRRVAEGSRVAFCLVARSDLEPGGIDIGRQLLRTTVPGARDLGDGDAPGIGDDMAGFEPNILGLRLEQARADALHAHGQLIAGLGDRAPRDDHATRAPGAGRIRGLGGVAMHELDQLMRNAEYLVGDLRERRLMTLAVTVRADAQLQAAIGREPRVALLEAGDEGYAPTRVDARPVSRLLGIHGDPKAEKAPVRFAAPLSFAGRFNVDGGKTSTQGFGIVAAVEMALGDIVERHLLGPHQALEAQIAWLLPKLPCKRIEGHLEREANSRARHAAIGQNGWLVCRDRVGAAAVMRKI